MSHTRSYFRRPLLALAVCAAFLPTSHAGDDGCAPGWEATFGAEPFTPLGGAVVVTLDLGDGADLYIGGGFNRIGGIAANNIARWEGVAWSALGVGVNDAVADIAVFDDGDGPALYVAGAFTQAGGVPANRIAKWDGETWSSFGPGLDNFTYIYELEVYDDGNGPALYAAGDFTTIGGVQANRIAKWDGQSWSALGSGIGGSRVSAMVVFDSGHAPGLYVAGLFQSAGGSTANSVARWDGASWSPVGGGLPPFGGEVRALVVHDDGSGEAMYAAGNFTSVGGVSAMRVAKWNGQSWSALGIGLPYPTTGYVSALASYHDASGPKLVAAGRFQNAGASDRDCVAQWDGQSWSALGAGVGNGFDSEVRSLAPFDAGDGPRLFATGHFETASGVGTGGLAVWYGATWAAPYRTGVNGPVYSATVSNIDGEPSLYVGGDFDSADGLAMNRIARWTGDSWAPVGQPTWATNVVYALAQFDDHLYAAGGFISFDEPGQSRIAQWDGDEWTALQSGLTGGDARAMAVFDDGHGAALYVGGVFSHASGLEVNRVARWDGDAWSALGSGVVGFVYAMAAFDDGSGPALYIGGFFSEAGGVPANGVARWDGRSWSAVGDGFNGAVHALCVLDTGANAALYAGGGFTSTGQSAVNRVARWNGAAWEPVGEGFANGVVRSLTTWDDGTGVDIYAGGGFTASGSESINRVAKSNGDEWSALDEGIINIGFPSEVHAVLGARSLGLVITGDFRISPKGDAPVALWRGCEVACPGDANGDNIVNFADLNAVLADFGATGPNLPGDVDGDGAVDFADLNLVLSNFGLGC